MLNRIDIQSSLKPSVFKIFKKLLIYLDSQIYLEQHLKILNQLRNLDQNKLMNLLKHFPYSHLWEILFQFSGLNTFLLLKVTGSYTCQQLLEPFPSVLFLTV